MFENYKATKRDFEAIEEGIKAVWQPKMNFIFQNRSLIENVVVISYDASFVYLWTKIKLPKLETFTCNLSNYHTYKIPHKIKIKDEWQVGWRTGLSIKQFAKLLPKKLQKSDFKIPKISGGLLKPFIELQKKKKGTKLNPYITYESYLATIVHEFGHIYYNQHKLWWYSDKKQNLAYLGTAEKLFEGKKIDLGSLKIRTPSPQLWSEVFAFCTDYYAASLFWSKHKRDIDQMNLIAIKKAIAREKPKNLEQQNSLFDEEKSSHLTAAIFGKIILARYPKTWPGILTQPKSFGLVL